MPGSEPGRAAPRPPDIGGPAAPRPPDLGWPGAGVLAVAADPSTGGPLIDLRGLRWCDPLHLAGTAALARQHLATGAGLRVAAPQDPEARRYAARMRLGRILSELGAEHDFPRVPERDRREDLLELREVRQEADALRLARLVARRARPDSPEASGTLFRCVVELAANVTEHSGAVGYVAAQTLPRQGWIRFAVADGGLGLRRTLAGRGAADDRTALQLALTGTSRFERPDRGLGLPTTRDELVRADGWLSLTSGTAVARAGAAEHRVGEQRPAFSGTLVQGAVRIAQGVYTSGNLGPDLDAVRR